MPQKQIYTGLKRELRSRKDFIREQALGSAPNPNFVRGERLNKILNSPLKELWPEQGQDNSCVSCSFTFVNQYNSYFNDNNCAWLSWQFLYQNVPHYPPVPTGSTKVRENGEFLRKTGQSKINETINPEKFKIKSYFYTANLDTQSIKDVLTHAPVIVGCYTDEVGLSTERFGHAIVLIDLDEKGDFVAANWWGGEENIVTIPASVKFFSATTIEDLPDNLPKDQVRLGYTGLFQNIFSKLFSFLII